MEPAVAAGWHCAFCLYLMSCPLARYARGAGHWGSAAICLRRTVEKRDDHGIRDRNLWKLQTVLAAEIRAAAVGRVIG